MKVLFSFLFLIFRFFDLFDFFNLFGFGFKVASELSILFESISNIMKVITS